jgi:hypothetical protein
MGGAAASLDARHLPIPQARLSGGWSTVFEKVCDVVEERLAAERTVLPGAGHNVQDAPGFNEGLLSFLSAQAVV